MNHQHWTYIFKGDGHRKAQNCCNGSKCAAPHLQLAQTYALCIEQPCMHLFFTLCAVKGLYICMADATNAFVNSPAPTQPTFVQVNENFADWYKE